MTQHYLRVEGGDTVLIDLGGYGLEVSLDPNRLFYDEIYVGIDYDEQTQSAVSRLIPADVVVLEGDPYQPEQMKPTTVKQATAVRIYRHGPGSPSGG